MLPSVLLRAVNAAPTMKPAGPSTPTSGGGIPAGYGSDDDFEYDEFIEQELPEKRTINGGRELSRWSWRALVALVCLALLRYLWR
jgi:hypothetical protein